MTTKGRGGDHTADVDQHPAAVVAAIKEFFGTSQLNSWDCKPTHKRRPSALVWRFVTRACRAEVRDVHLPHTPDVPDRNLLRGPNGLIGLAVGVRGSPVRSPKRRTARWSTAWLATRSCT